jgi:hypothetical protein
MQTFIIRPPHVRLPPDLTHPVQLYDHFIRYHDIQAAPTFFFGTFATSAPDPPRPPAL